MSPLDEEKQTKCQKDLNKKGYKMLEFCKNNNLFILIGRLGNNTTNSKFTSKERSCIDYFVSTAFVLDLVDFFAIGDFDPFLSDSHILLLCI